MKTKQILVSRAWIAKKLKRYDDLYACMRAVSQSGEFLTKKERTLFYLAYQHILKPYRDGWYKLLVISRLVDGSQRKMQLTKEYMNFVERQWMEYSIEAVNAIDTLLVRANRPRPKIFYLKMRADLTRYLIEISGSAKARRKRLLKETKSAYVEASQLCEEKLSPIHPLRLAVALAHAVYLAHVKGKKEMAINLAKAALTEAKKKLSQDKTEIKSKLKKVTALLQLLRDNIVFWAPRGSDEDEINGPIKEAKMLSRNDYMAAGAGALAGGKSKAALKGTVEGKYGRPTLVDEYEVDMAEEASTLANQIVLIEQFNSPPLSEELSSTSEDGNEEVEEEEEEDLEPRLSELLKGEDELREEVEQIQEEGSEEEEEEGEEEEGDLHLDDEGQFRKSSVPAPAPGPTKLVPPGGITPFVFTPFEDDLLYKKVQQEEEYLAELAANKTTVLQREELIAIKAAAKATESELDTGTIPRKSTTVLGEKLSDEGSTSESSETEAGEDDRYSSDNDQETEDRLVEQILDEFFKVELAKIPQPGDETSSMTESCASSVSSGRSVSSTGSVITVASSYSGAISRMSRSTITSEQQKRKASKAKSPEEEEPEIDEEEAVESDEEVLEGEVEEPKDELEENDQFEPSDSLLDIQSLGSDSDFMDNYFDDHDQDDSGHIEIEEPESEESEEEETVEEEEEEVADEEKGEPSASKASVDTSDKPRKHKHNTRSHSRIGSKFGSEGVSTSFEDSRASPASISSRASVSSGSVSSSSVSTTSTKEKASKKSKKRTGAGDYFHPLPPGPKSAFDQRKYVDEFSAVVQNVEAGLGDFEFSPERFKEIDRVLDFLEDQEERRELAETEGHRMEVRDMIVEDSLVKLMFTDFRIVYPEYDHYITTGVNIAEEENDDESEEESEDEARRNQRRMSSAAGAEREDAATRNETEDKAEIDCLLEYPDEFKDYQEAHFKAEYVKIEQPFRSRFGRYQKSAGEYEYRGEYDDLEVVDAILQPRLTEAGTGLDGSRSHASIDDTLKPSKSIRSVRLSEKKPDSKSKTRVSVLRKK